jgi:mannose-1-phosphate guanylyltransferase
MKALLLAAGQGTRLKPVTDVIPKPLLPIVDQSMIDINLKRLLSAGASTIAINLFHKHKIIEHHLKKYGARVCPVIEDVLKGTGGALLNFIDFLEDDFIFQSTDVISDIEYRKIIDVHKQRKPIATLLMIRRHGTKFRIDKDNMIERIFPHDDSPYTYAGIGVFSSKIFSFLPEDPVFSILDVFQNILKKGESIIGMPAVMQWYNVNSYYDYWQIHHDVLHGSVKIESMKYPSPIYIAPSSNVRSKSLRGFVSIGDNCTISEDVRLENTVVLPGSSIASGDYRNCVISDLLRVAVT